MMIYMYASNSACPMESNEHVTCHMSPSCTAPYRFNTLAFEDIFIKLKKKDLRCVRQEKTFIATGCLLRLLVLSRWSFTCRGCKTTSHVCGSHCESSKAARKSEPTIRHSAVMRTEVFISFYLNQDGASRMLLYVGIYPCDASCKIRGSCWSIRMLQNDSPCSQILQYLFGETLDGKRP